MYLVLETYADCLPEIPLTTFATYDEALEVLRSWAHCAKALATGEGAEFTDVRFDEVSGTARVHSDREAHYWVGRIARVPGS